MVSLSKPSTAMRGLSSQLRFATVRASLLALAPRRGVKTPGAPRAAPQQQAAPAVPKSLREELGVPEFQDRIPTNWNPIAQYAPDSAATGIRADRTAFPATAPGDRKVFVKSYTTDAIKADDRLRREVAREVTAGTLVHHANIAPLLAVFINGERLYLVFEHRGTPVDKFIAPGHVALRSGAAAMLLSDLVPAVAAIHKAGLIHGDIKPENIVYDPETKRHSIIDLGSCRRADDPSLYEWTAPYVCPKAAAEIIAAVLGGATDKNQIMASVARLMGPLTDARALALSAAEIILGVRFYCDKTAAAAAAALPAPTPEGMGWEVSCSAAMEGNHHPWLAHEEWHLVPDTLADLVNGLGNGDPELRLSAERALLDHPFFAEAPAAVAGQQVTEPATAAGAASESNAATGSSCCDAIVTVLPAVLPAAKASPPATAAASVAAPATAAAFEPAAAGASDGASASLGGSCGVTDCASSGVPAAAALAPQPCGKRSLLSRGLHRLNKRANEACERFGRAVDGAAAKLRACVAPRVAM